MEAIPKELIAAIATVAAAIIAGLVAVASATLSKDAKISEFRLAWMDELRSEIAELVARCHYLLNFPRRLREDNADEKAPAAILEKMAPDIVIIQQRAAMIRMRLDPKKHNNVIGLIDRVETVDWMHTEDSEDASNLLLELQTASRDLLFGEWGRVKAGDGSHKIIRTTFKYLTVLFLGVLIALVGKAAWIGFGA